MWVGDWEEGGKGGLRVAEVKSLYSGGGGGWSSGGGLGP